MYRSKVLPDSSQLWDKYPQHFIWHILIPPEQGRPRTKQRTTLVDVIEQHKAGEYCMRRTNLAISDCLAHENPRRWRPFHAWAWMCASLALKNIVLHLHVRTCFRAVLPWHHILCKVCCHCHPGPVALWLVTRGRSLFFYLSLTHTRTQSEVGPKGQCETKESAARASPNQGHAPGREETLSSLSNLDTQPHKCSQKETNTATCLAGNTARPISSTRQHTQMHCRGNDDEGRVCMDSILALVFFADKEGGK